jgi:outer membrane protein OmpA-like peptidoglycan-associated protein
MYYSQETRLRIPEALQRSGLILNRTTFLPARHHNVYWKSLIPICLLATFNVVALGVSDANAQQSVITDTSIDTATVDGTISPEEYAGASFGLGTENSLIGNGSQILMDSSANTLHFGWSTGGELPTDQVIVFYIDPGTSLFIPTSPLVATGGPHDLAVASVELGITYATGFNGSIAVAVDGTLASVYLITGTAASFVASYPVTFNSSYEWAIPFEDLGIQLGVTLRWLVTAVDLLTQERLGEYHGVSNPPSTTSGTVVLTESDYNLFVAPGYPIQVDTFDDELNDDGDCSLPEALATAAGIQADNCVFPGGKAEIILPTGNYTLSNTPDISGSHISITGQGSSIVSGAWDADSETSLELKDLNISLEGAGLAGLQSIQLNNVDITVSDLVETPGLGAKQLKLLSSTVECLGDASTCLFSVEGASITNSTIRSTSGTLVTCNSGLIEVSSSTLVGQGPLFQTNSVQYRSSVLEGTECGTGGQISLGQNLIKSSLNCPLGNGDVASDNLLLGVLAENGGPTRTILPSTDSEAIDLAIECDLSVDQRGALRPSGLACDAGSVERLVLADTGVSWTQSANNGGVATEVATLTLQISSNTIAEDISISVALPDGLSFAAVPPECISNPLADILDCTYTVEGSLNLPIQVQGTAAEAGVYSVVAQINGQPDNDFTNDTATASISFSPALGIAIQSLEASVEPDEPIVAVLTPEGTCAGSVNANISFSSQMAFDILPTGCTEVSDSLLSCSNLILGSTLLIRGIPDATTGQVVTVTAIPGCTAGSQTPVTSSVNIPVQADPCTTHLKFTGEAQGMNSNNGLFELLFVAGDGFFKTGGTSTVPIGIQSGTLSRAFEVPDVLNGGTAPQLEVVYSLSGSPNPSADRFSVCINDTACATQGPSEAYGTGRNTVPGSPPFIQASDNDFNDGTFDHIFIDLSDFVGQSITVTLAFNSVLPGDGNSDGVTITRLRLGSDADGDGLYEGDDTVCDPCWDADQDGFVHPLSPGLTTSCPNGSTPDCDDTLSTTNPTSLEQCGVTGDEDCDGFADADDTDCGDEDCADGLDNNGDGATDCADTECNADPFCDACSTSFTFATGPGGWSATDNDPDNSDTSQLFKFTVSASGTGSFSTGTVGTISSQSTAATDAVQAWLTRKVSVPIGLPEPRIEIEYELDGDSDPDRDIFGVCLAATPEQCTAASPPGLIAFKTGASTVDVSTASIPVPAALTGTEFNVVIFYDTVDLQANDNTGLTIHAVHSRSDADQDGLFEGLALSCDRCVDQDGDGYGAKAVPVEYILTCEFAEADCDDLSSNVSPGAPELCQIDGDQNCNGLLDHQEPQCSICGDGMVTAGESCDDGGANSGDGCNDLCEVESGALIFTELHVNTLTATGNGEQWIELHNTTDNATIDLALAPLQLRRKTGATTSLAECNPATSSNVLPGEYVVISLGSQASADGTPADFFCDGAIQLSTDGDLVELISSTELGPIDAVDYRTFDCLTSQTGAYGISRSMELVSTINETANDQSSAWCIAVSDTSFSNSGNHFGSPGSAGECGEYACDSIDDDCNGMTDDGLQDSDGDGTCDEVDCAPSIATCTTDCVTDVDADEVADCEDGCIDSDLDGWGYNGGAEVPTCNQLNGVPTEDCNDTNPAVNPLGIETPEAGQCTNGLDEDCDGLFDCADTSCSSSPQCAAEACPSADGIACGDSRTLEPITDAFACGSGVDAVLEFTPTSNAPITLTLQNTGRLQYEGYILPNNCDGTSCSSAVAVISTSCQNSGQVIFSPVQGTTYYLVLDAISECSNTGTSEVTLTYSCAESCVGLIDEDTDGLTDCADADCAQNTACAEFDTDLDGVTNSLEVACGTNPTDSGSTPTADDLQDPDSDSIINCVDLNDDGDPVVDALELACAAGAKNDATIYPGAPKQCQTQTIDADCNGLLDISEDGCGAAEQQCGDEEDNDNDGLADCFDLDCVSTLLCSQEDFDNDGVSNATELLCLTKANDPNSTPTAQEASDEDGDNLPNCADTDDDGDGFNDIEEILCGSNAMQATSVPIDTDGDTQCDASDPDDDGDGFADELELDCGSSPLIASEIPIDAQYDLDGDGICDAKDLDIDGDGWSNGVEETCGTNLLVAELNPSTQGLDNDNDQLCNAVDPDDDNDGWSDELEGLCLTIKTDPTSVPPDEDNDGICDLLDEDTDGDGWPDELEVQCETDPGNAASNPTLQNQDQDNDILCDALDSDDDGDGWLDTTEVQCGSDPSSAASTPADLDNDLTCDGEDDDLDGDGWDNSAEELCGSEATDPVSIPTDTDLDGVCDAIDPDADPDGDGWDSFTELSCNTDPKDGTSTPLDTDSDGSCNALDTDDDNDTWPDADELVCGSNPLVQSSVPVDTDADSICNTLDTDDDADGTPDADELLCGTDPLDSTVHPTENMLLDYDGDLEKNCVDLDDDNDGLPDLAESLLGTKPNDKDTDDDGLLDGVEDANQNGVLDPGETDATRTDTDGDNLKDGAEVGACYLSDGGGCIGSDPTLADTDNDGLPDGIEDADLDGIADITETNPLVANTDGDADFAGIPASDGQEVLCNTDPLDPSSFPLDLDDSGVCDGSETDSDGDGIADGVETLCGTNPFSNASTPALFELFDTDGDGLIDCVDTDDDNDGVGDQPETVCGTDPLDAQATPTAQAIADPDEDGSLNCIDPDDDNDGLSDEQEAQKGTDPYDTDSDDDGINDGQEVDVFGTDPTAIDTDADGIQDGTELGFTTTDASAGTDLTVFQPDQDPDTVTNPKNADTDDDGLSDGAEDTNKNGRLDPEEGNPLSSEDGLRDTDGDGLIDRREVALGTDPKSPDTDNDGLSDKLEVDVHATNPLIADTDGGGVVDGIEVENGTNPGEPQDDFSLADVSGDDAFSCQNQPYRNDSPEVAVWLVLLCLLIRISHKRKLLFIVLVAMTLPDPAAGQAQAVGNGNTENFFPAGGRYRVFSVEQSQVGPTWQPYAHIVVHGQRDSLKVNNGPHLETLIANQYNADLNIGVGVLGILQVDLGLPIGLETQSADDVTSIAPIRGAGVGDLTLRAKATAIENRLGGFGLGFTLGFTFPTGDQQQFLSDTGVGITASAIADYHSRWITLALNLGVRLRTELVDFLGHEFGHELTYGLGLDVHLWRSVIDLGLELYGRTQLLSPFANTDGTTLEVLAGPKWWILPELSLQTAAGAGVIQGVGTPDFRFLLGLTYAPRTADSDGDGLDDELDECPLQAEDTDGFADWDGCPEADNDHDGIADADDRCPIRAEDINGDSDQDGCPDGDSDADGLADYADKCPQKAEDRDLFEDGDGCPDPDNDGDGILDLTDKCPMLAENVNGFMDQDGCPDGPAKSGAGLTTQNAPQTVAYERTFCSQFVPISLRFKGKGTRLRIRSRNKIPQVVQHIQRELERVGESGITEIAVLGHVSMGPPLKSLMLSSRRAQSVRDMLVAEGIPRAIIHARGFGRSGPVEHRNQVKLRIQFTPQACSREVRPPRKTGEPARQKGGIR